VGYDGVCEALLAWPRLSSNNLLFCSDGVGGLGLDGNGTGTGICLFR
jgi:hypothetical protein